MMQLARYTKEPLYRNSLFLMFNHGLITGFGFFFWMVVARFYTEAEVGLGAAIISAISLLALLGKLGFDVALVRFLPTAARPSHLINSCLTLATLAALVIAGIFVAGLHVWSPALIFIQKNALFTTAFIFFTVFWTLFGVSSAIFVARRRASFALSKNAVYSLLKIPLPIVLGLFFHAFGIVASWGIASGAALAVSVFVLLPRTQHGYRPVPKIDLGVVRDIRRYAAGNYFANLLYAAPGLVLPLIIVNLLGPEENAYFYVAWTIGGLLFAIPAAVAASLFAEGSHFEVPLGMNVGRSYKFIFLILIPSIAVIMLAAKWLLLAFGPGYSANALRLLWVLALSSVFHGISSAYYSVLRVQGKARELAGIYAFMSIAVLVGSYFILPVTGIVGVGYVWIGAQAVVSLYVVVRMRTRAAKAVPGQAVDDQEWGL